MYFTVNILLSTSLNVLPPTPIVMSALLASLSWKVISYWLSIKSSSFNILYWGGFLNSCVDAKLNSTLATVSKVEPSYTASKPVAEFTGSAVLLPLPIYVFVTTMLESLFMICWVMW